MGLCKFLAYIIQDVGYRIRKTQQQIQNDDYCQKQFQEDKQQIQSDQQQQQLNHQKEESQEENQYQAEMNREDELGIKIQDEINQSKSIPLFYYRPSFQMSKQNQNINIENQEIEQKQLNNSIIKIRNEFIQQKQKGKVQIEEDSPYYKNEIFTQQSNSCNKQNSSIISESFFSQSKNLKLKAAQKDEQIKNFLVKNQQETKEYPQNHQKQLQQVKQKQFQHLLGQSSNEEEEVSECINKLKVIQDSKISAKIKRYLFGQTLCKKRYKSEDIQYLSRKQESRINNQINQDLNILNFIKDMIFLKKAILLLLRKDQLAALNLIGFSPNSLELDFKNLDSNTRKKYQLSYYEMQNAILQSEKLQQYQMQKFLKRCKNNLNSNEIDERIFQSLQQNQIL
ncbi:hypothetical protein ABPG73_008957 [Tetrahymena malaccensis]